MAGFLTRFKSASSITTSTTGKDAAVKKKEKEEPPPELTPLEKMLQNAGPLPEDGSGRFLGLENFGNTCYCNSVVQALFYQEAFREHVVNYPPPSPSDSPNGVRPKVQVTIRPPIKKDDGPNGTNKKMSPAESIRRRQAAAMAPLPGQPGPRPEDRPGAPEYKKKQAMIKGPVVELNQENPNAYGMAECTFTGLKDIFGALMESESRTGVLSPQRFLEIFKRDNEMFRNSMHQDAHEFYGLVLNDVIANVEANAKRLREKEEEEEAANKNGTNDPSAENGLASADSESSSQITQVNGIVKSSGTSGTGWVHDIFEGVLTSETTCLTCETASQRDETFLDLSIDLEEHSSVTSCLRQFSAEEMLCERNKFHCDHCGGLQEAEKRMKIKRLPKVLALHLKRFKYTEDYSRLQKLFHRVVYPYHLRMFNTTDDAEDPDRLYELYAVVVHIGGNAYHGHYVSVIKTKDRGWLLFDDEMVEPVDKHFVRNFFGDKPGTACAYVLFYQETTFEKVQAEMEAEGLEEVKMANEAADLAAQANGQATVIGNGVPLSKQTSQPLSPVDDREAATASLAHAQTVLPGVVEQPNAIPPTVHTIPESTATSSLDPSTASASVSVPGQATEAAVRTEPKTREERKREKKEQEAAEKARKVAEKEKRKQEEKNFREGLQRRRVLQLQESEELRQAIEESKRMAEEENEARKALGDNNKADATKSPPVASPSLMSPGGFLNRANKSMAKRSFSFLAKDRDRDRGEARPSGESGSPGAERQGPGPGVGSGPSPGPASNPTEQKLKDRFSFSLGRKKSTNILS